MTKDDFHGFDRDIARTRIALSLLALLSLYIDPTAAGGLFHLTPYALAILLAHLAYSTVIYLSLHRDHVPGQLPRITTVLDLLFATAITCVAEGMTSPSYIFFIFAIIAVGVRSGLRTTSAVTLGGVALYVLIITLTHKLAGAYVMRAVYLAIVGYLVAIFGQLRVSYERRLRELESRAERQAIARSLHDSYVQSLAGVNLRLETCRELLRRDRPADAATELAQLQLGVVREYDDVRGYIRGLAGLETAAPRATSPADPEAAISMRFASRSLITERILQIALEGLRNARKHARATRVTIDAAELDQQIVLTITDDGIGFNHGGAPPWTIASHVAEMGGQLNLSTDGAADLRVAISKF